MNIKKNVLNVVIDYVKDLLPINGNNKFKPQSAEDMKKDAQTLAYMSANNIFFTNARNGTEYLYCFIANEADIAAAKYILQSNGLAPKLHTSRYYHTPMLTLRTSTASIMRNKTACDFVTYLMAEVNNFIRFENVEEHLQQIRQKVR